MDLQSIATESQTLRSQIRDLRSVIATDKERLERHEGELKAALLRLDELESEASVAFAAIRTAGGARGAGDDLVPVDPGPGDRPLSPDSWALIDRPSPFGEPSQVAAE